MILNIKDKKYNNLIKDIIRNPEIKKMANIEHHGISRLEHSLKVSYKAYRIAKRLHFDYISVARGGLLHDFYLEGNERNNLHKFTDTFIHPNKALNTTKSIFEINKIEENIIISHMFPIYLSIPKYKESILVNLIDKIIGTKEMLLEYKAKTKYYLNYSYLILLLLITK